MKGLNYFQAEALALAGRAVRRDGWRFWALHRGNLWLTSRINAETGAEIRRVVQAGEWRDSEFMASDFTDEPWEGGSFPPCTVPGPVTAAPVSRAAWTFDGRCGGAGNGGAAPGMVGPAGEGGVGLLSAEFYAALLVPNLSGGGFQPDYANGGTFEHPPRERDKVDGFTCWVTPPAKYWGFVSFSVAPSAWPAGVPEPLSDETLAVEVWFSSTGVDLSAIAYEDLEGTADVVLSPSAGGMPSSGLASSNGGLTAVRYFGTGSGSGHYPGGFTNGYDLTPGTTITARVVLKSHDGETVLEELHLEYVITEECASETYYSTEQTYMATCAAGSEGDSQTVTIAAGVFTSTVSQEAANALALAAATAAATGMLSCTPVPSWSNTAQTYTAYCPPGFTGGPSTVTIPEGVWVSYVSQEDADALALAAAQVDAEGGLDCEEEGI